MNSWQPDLVREVARLITTSFSMMARRPAIPLLSPSVGPLASTTCQGVALPQYSRHLVVEGVHGGRHWWRTLLLMAPPPKGIVICLLLFGGYLGAMCDISLSPNPSSR